MTALIDTICVRMNRETRWIEAIQVFWIELFSG
jgi:hypothetical protein